MSTTARSRLLRLGLVAASVVVALLAGELLIRLLRPQEVMTIRPPGLYVPDPPRRYRLRPGYRGELSNLVEFRHAVRVNGLGMRGPEPARRAAPTLRSPAHDDRREALAVLALGDSFTFGVGAAESETYPVRLAADLRAEGVVAEVWNAGAPGYGLPDEAAWYAQWGVPMAPDVVVIAAFLANDLQDAAPGSTVRVVGGELVVDGEGRGSASAAARRWLYYHSHLFRLLKASLLDGPLRHRLGLAEPWARRQRRGELALYGASLPPALAAGAAASERAIGELAARAGRHHTRLLAVLVPSLPQVDPGAWRVLHAELGVDPRDQDARRPNRLFAAMFSRHGIPVVDTSEALAAALARGERVYYPIDQHLTPLGYELLARQVAAALLRDARGAAP